MKPIVAIGDVHGLTAWKPIVDRHPDCRIVFLGDYLDPYGYVSRPELLANLRDIIALKASRPDDVVLILGNHDMHYFCSEATMGSRYDPWLQREAFQLFVDHFDLFQNAYQDGNRIFTHAGIAQSWFLDDFGGDPARPIAWQLNHASDIQVRALCRVGQVRGGRRGAVGGIFWADMTELTDPLHGFTQIVGHNRVPQVTVRTGDHENQIVFCDCLRNGGYYVLK